MKISIDQIIKRLLIPAVVLPLAFSSCDKEQFDGEGDGEEGYVRLRLNNDLQPVTVTKTGDEIIYCVDLTDSQGAVVQSYTDHTQIPEQIKLKRGDYTVTAYNGEQAEAGFDTPYYAGDTTVSIQTANLTTAEVVCRLANTKVSVGFSDAVKNNFTEYAVTVSNGTDEGALIYAEDETRAGYFKTTGQLTWTVNLVNNQGTPFTTGQTILDVKPREHYRLYFDVDETGNPSDGGVSVTITVDDATNDRDHDIDVLLNKKAKPQIAGSGFDISAPVQAAVGETISCDVSIVAEATISDVKIAHASSYLSSLGIPETFSLIAIDAATAATVNGQGITWSTPVSEAVSVRIGFGELLAKLPIGEYVFTISVLDAQNQLLEQDLQIAVVPDVEVEMLGVDAWAKFATFKAEWKTYSKPATVGFEYKTADAAEWTAIPESSVTILDSGYEAKVKLDSATNYVVRAVTGNSQSTQVAFTTEKADRMPNMNFDDWTYIDNKTWYAGKDLLSDDITSGNYWWDSGNKGANTLSAVNPTSKETENVVKGNAVKMATTTVFTVMAAGNIYTGQFGKTVGTSGAEIYFGRPYTCRPLKLTGYYSYSSGKIDKTKAPYESFSGMQDSCHIYIALCDWTGPFTVNTTTSQFMDFSDPDIIAFGELKTDQSTNGYQKFTIDIEYRDTTRKPTYIVMVASASKYGDYFTGSTSSVLYLDEMDFIFDEE